MTGNQEVQVLSNFVPPAQSMLTNLASNNLQEALGVGLQTIGGAEVQNIFNPAMATAGMAINGNGLGAASNVTDMASNALTNIGTEEARQVQENMD